MCCAQAAPLQLLSSRAYAPPSHLHYPAHGTSPTSSRLNPLSFAHGFLLSLHPSPRKPNTNKQRVRAPSISRGACPCRGATADREGSQMDDAPAGHRGSEPNRCPTEQAPPDKLKEASELLSSAPSAASAAAEARPGHRAEEPSGCLVGKRSATPSKLKEAKEASEAEARPGHPFAPWQLGLMQGGAEPVRVARAWHGSGLLTVPFVQLRRAAQRSRTSRRGSSASGCCERPRERAGCQLDTRGRPSGHR